MARLPRYVIPGQPQHINGFDQIVETPGRLITTRGYRRDQQRPRLDYRVGWFGDNQLNQLQTRRRHRPVGEVLQIDPLYPGEVQQRPIGRGWLHFCRTGTARR